MNEEITMPKFLPKKINGLWYWSDFARWVSKNFWPSANALEAFLLGLGLIAFTVLLAYWGYLGARKVASK